MAELTATMNEPSQNPYNTRWGTSGTLGSQGLYQGVAPPRQSQAQGIQGTDNRAYTRNVGGNELVENRLGGLMNRGGAYMQNAARRGMETANRRGLLNSSIASGAAERSSLEAAMPIAQADAAAYSRAQTENLDALNRGLMQERDILNQQTLEGQRQAGAGISAGIQAQIAREQMALDLQRQRENLAFSGEQQGLDRSQQQWLAQFGLGADLTRGQQGFGFQSALNQQGFTQDMARMGQQFRYEDMAAQRDFRNSIIGADFAQRQQTQSAWTNGFILNYWQNPDMFNQDDLQFFANSGQTLFPASVRSFRSIIGGG